MSQLDEFRFVQQPSFADPSMARIGLGHASKRLPNATGLSQLPRQSICAGVDIIEAGFPVASPDDFEAVSPPLCLVVGMQFGGNAVVKVPGSEGLEAVSSPAAAVAGAAAAAAAPAVAAHALAGPLRSPSLPALFFVVDAGACRCVMLCMVCFQFPLPCCYSVLAQVRAIAMDVGNAVDETGYVPVICGLSRTRDKVGLATDLLFGFSPWLLLGLRARHLRPLAHPRQGG